MIPSSKLRWGILGAGNIAGKMLAIFPTCQRARAVAIASRSAERAEQLARKHGLQRAHIGYEKLIADPEVDIIYNSFHNGLHAEWTIRALEAGKHVLCEKPLAPTEAEARAMFDAARRSGRLLMEGFMYRFHPQLDIVRRLLAENAIGKVKLIRAGYTNPRSYDGTPRWLKSCHGGAFMDMGCYGVDISRVITNEFPTEIGSVSVAHPIGGADLTTAGVLKFPGGCVAIVHASFQTGRTHYCEILGETGSIDLPHPWRGEEVPLPVIVIRNGQREELQAPAANPFRLELDYFSGCVACNRQPVFPGCALTAEADSIENARVLESFLRDSGQRRPS